MENRKKILSFSFILILFIMAFTFVFLSKTDLLIDEHDHFAQIIKLANGDFSPNKKITTLLGYHYTMGLLTSLTGSESKNVVRFFSLLFAFASVFVFFLLAGKISREWQFNKLYQYAAFPLIFPFFFLIYTDIFSLLFILLALLFFLDKKYFISGSIMILSMIVRQNNIIWLGMLCCMIVFEKYDFKINLTNIRSILKDTWIYFAGLLLFIAFIIINKGVAVGDVSMHPSFRLHSGNIFFMFFVLFIIFLPLHISNTLKIIAMLKKRFYIVIPLAVAVFLLYWFTYKVDHRYNQIGLDFFLRNKILITFVSSRALKLLFFVPVLYSLLSLAVTALHKKSFYLLYPFTILALAPAWLIEQRYYIVPFVLFLLFKKNRNRIAEYCTITYYIVLSSVWVYGMGTAKFFI